MLKKSKIKSIQKSTDLRVDDQRILRMFDALGDPGRYKIFKVLAEYHDLCVSDVASICEISVPAASQQLKILERSELVKKERHGQTICYIVESSNPIVALILKII